MTVVYSVSEHPLLGGKAKAAAANEEYFAELTAVAAQLLGVSETVYTGSALESVERAIVLQLNYMSLIEPRMFVYVAESSSHSKQAVTYRDDIGLILPAAAALVRAVNTVSGIGWDNIKAIR